MVRNRPSNVRHIRFERMLEQAKDARTEFLREKSGLFWRSVKRTSSSLGIAVRQIDHFAEKAKLQVTGSTISSDNGGFHAQIRL
jgi:hypothetical protein